MACKRHQITKNSGKIAEMVNGVGWEEIPPITALQRRETMLGGCYHPSKEAGDGVVKGSGPCAMRKAPQLSLTL
jgi:hypothetical protein